ncbi:F-box domain-containing protein [Mycena indigotica]|uniref:F-box domain-containing protein n=1 Tax=Mycena indigotica TaxID=2126181 RepID=A0A8H6WH35_9AGAR|nr:F-box domain-containing protein [Mycena indigotica]KAF7316576.1 F-box domain-containing protein [Mycena indigotica]
MNAATSTQYPTCICTFKPPPAPSAAERERIVALLRSSQPVPQSTHLEILAQIDDAQKEVANYDTHIANLEGLVRQATAERDKLSAHIELCRGVVDSPIRQLPAEILGQIFELCVLTQEHGKDMLSGINSFTIAMERLAKPSLFSLSLVCLRWRDVTWSTSSLWNQLVVHADILSWKYASLALLERVLARGCGQPLDFQASCRGQIEPQGHIIRALMRHSHRWRRVALHVTEHTALPLLERALNRLDALEVLDLDIGSLNASEKLSAPIRAFSAAFHLKKLSFSGHIGNLPILPPSQWRQLTFLSCRVNLNSADLADYATELLASPLNQLPENASVVFKFCYDPLRGNWELPIAQNIPPSNPTTILRVHSFTLWMWASARGTIDDHLPTRSILSCLSLPQLTSLTVRIPPHDHRNPPTANWNHAAFCALAERSGWATSLTTLKITAVMSDRELSEALAHLHSLEYLLVDTSNTHFPALFTTTVLQRLTVPDRSVDADSQILIPRLTHLSIGGDLWIIERVLSDFVESRIQYLNAQEPPLVFTLELFPPKDARENSQFHARLFLRFTEWIERKQLRFTVRATNYYY